MSLNAAASATKVLSIGGVVLALGYFLAYFPGGETKEASRRTACLSNVKQLGVSVALYCADHNDKLPGRDDWMTVTALQRRGIVYCCPVRFKVPGAQCGYAFNSFLEHKKPYTLEDTGAVPQIYDSVNLAFNASDPFLSLCPVTPEMPRRSIGFLDGHVRAVGREAPRWQP